MEYEIVSRKHEFDFMNGSSHTMWVVKLDYGYVYVSHQTHAIFASGPECMAFICDEAGEVKRWDTELAVNNIYDPDEAFAAVMRRLAVGQGGAGKLKNAPAGLSQE